MEHKCTVKTILSVSFLLVTSCGKSNFTDTSKPTVQPSSSQTQDILDTHSSGTTSSDSMQDNGNSSETRETQETTVTPLSPDEQILARCLDTWQNSPFTKESLGQYKRIYASVSVLGLGNAIKDTEVTSSPKLILVDAAVSTLSNTKYVLMNPNGWYCIKVGVNILSKIDVRLQCDAHISESKDLVNVGAKADSIAGVGVNVLSYVKITRQKEQNSSAQCD